MKTRKNIKTAAAIIIATAVIVAPAAAYAANTEDSTAVQQTASIEVNSAQNAEQTADRQGPMGFGQSSGNYADSPSEIVTSTLTENSAESLKANTANAETIVMSNSNSEVKISKAGTYIVTGTCSNGNITVKKGTTGVVLILKDLDLTSTTGATVSLNKGTEVKVIIEGTVTLTDAEDIADEDTDDFDGAAIKAKAGSSVVLTGDGTLNIKGSCKNGIKVSDLDADDKNDGYKEASFIIDGKDLTVNVTASNDGINSGTDLTIKSGTINVSAGDDGIKADYILTLGEEGGSGLAINVAKSKEGLEGATINIYSGNIDVVASDDGINAANGDLTGYTYSLNIMGGTINITSGADGIDSNGNVNIIGGLTTIVKSASNGGEGGLDYNGTCYIADGTFENPYGTTMDSGMGEFGGMGGRGQTQPGGRDKSGSEDTPQNGDSNSGMPDFGGSFPGMDGEMPDFGGSFPGMDGEMPQFGGRDRMNGGQFPGGQNGEMPQIPGMDGEMPDFSGSWPGMNGEQPNGQSDEQPDGSSSATPENGGRQRPGSNGSENPSGETPQTPNGGSSETPNGVSSQTPNNIPEPPEGTMRSDIPDSQERTQESEGSQRPGNNRSGAPNDETPQDQDSIPDDSSSSSNQDPDTTENTQSTNWFIRLIETIKRWFSTTFN